MASQRLSTPQITAYQRRNQASVRDLLFHTSLTHTHLDWYETDQWLERGDPVVRLAWVRGRLVGVMGVSNPLNSTSWLRLAAVSSHVDRQAVLYALWQELAGELRERGVRLVALLAVRDWIGHYAPVFGFQYGEQIVTLARSGANLPNPLPERPVIRPADQNDLAVMAQVDQTAFVPPWQMAYEELRQAYRMSTNCTVAQIGGEIVGYQLSTLYFDGAHLARLAVLPNMQGRGIGGALLGDCLARFFRRGIYSMTVNTQASNLQSQRLYTRFGFHLNGYNLPYWFAAL